MDEDDTADFVADSMDEDDHPVRFTSAPPTPNASFCHWSIDLVLSERAICIVEGTFTWLCEVNSLTQADMHVTYQVVLLNKPCLCAGYFHDVQQGKCIQCRPKQ